MAQFEPGDDLIFQLESGFGLLRVLAVEGEGAGTVWHLLAYDDFFPDVESAEAALAGPTQLPVRRAHMALTNRAFERTPAARLGNRPVGVVTMTGSVVIIPADEGLGLPFTKNLAMELVAAGLRDRRDHR